jgi:hypothetical protein
MAVLAPFISNLIDIVELSLCILLQLELSFNHVIGLF